MNSSRIEECTDLASEILRNFELSEIPINNIILKGLRLCRLLGDDDGILLFTFESSGYPFDKTNNFTPEAWRIAKIAGRRIFEIEKDKTGKDQYINRLIQFIASKSNSSTYNSIVGSDLKSIGERLDAINDAVCKGTHTDITKEEASKYLIHTYIIIVTNVQCKHL